MIVHKKYATIIPKNKRRGGICMYTRGINSAYIIYFLIYSFISYKTDYGFEYSTGFEYAWGFLLCSVISTVIDNIIYRLSYSWTGFFSDLCGYTSEERRKTHWKIRSLFAFIVLVITLTPLCSIVLTPVVHSSYILISDYCHTFFNRIINILLVP